MYMFWLETKKILLSPVIIISIAICAAFNLFNFFLFRLSPLETAVPENVFEDYKIDYVADAYINGLGLDGSVAEDMRRKYAAMQTVIEQKALNGDSFGQYTDIKHEDIFGEKISYLLIESVIIAALIMLLILGHEKISYTELTIYSSKTGRRIVFYKLAAALTVTFGMFSFLTVVTTVPLFIAYPDLLEQNISSAFNYYINDYLAGVRPFATWHSFTVSGYLWAVIAVSAGIVLCFSMTAYAIGTTIYNSYIGFVVLLLFTVFCVFAMILPRDNYLAFALMYSPACIMLYLPMWFTDGGMVYLWRNFETWGTCASLAILTATAFITTYKFKRRDIL